MSKSARHGKSGKPTGSVPILRKLVIEAALIVLLTVLVYIPAMRAGYVWDDDAYVTANPLLTTPDGLKSIWFSLDSPSQYFPLVYTTFRLERAIWGLNAAGYHVVNILLHIANALLLWLILRRLKIPGAWLASAIWALHPVNVESVAWITERKNTLSTLFYMLSVFGWMRSVEESGKRRWVYYGLSLLAFMSALFAKTTACTIPIALLAVLWLKGKRADWRRLAEIVPYAIMGLAMGLVSIWWEKNHQGTLGAQFAFSLPERFIIAGHALWFYLLKLAMPVRLTFSYPRWNINAAAPLQYLWSGLAIVGGAALWRYRNRIGNSPIIAAAFFAGTLAPLLGFINLYTFKYTFVADHYQYVACIAPVVLLAVLIHKSCRSQAFRAALSAVVLCTLGAMTFIQCKAYKDSETLWRDTISKNPSSPMAHDNLGIALAMNGDLDAAIEEHLAAIDLDPKYPDGHADLAITLVKSGRPEEAMDQCRIAMRLAPDFILPRTTLGSALIQSGRYAEAVRLLRDTLKAHPDNTDDRYNLAIALSRTGKPDEAVVEFRKVAEAQPYAVDAHQHLVELLYSRGDYEEAWKELHLSEQYGHPLPELEEALAAVMPEPRQ